jgi:hypothetical protein
MKGDGWGEARTPMQSKDASNILWNSLPGPKKSRDKKCWIKSLPINKEITK